MGEEHYKFKWPNVDCSDFVEGRRAVAINLRMEAKLLLTRADQIDEEIRIWNGALVPAIDE